MGSVTVLRLLRLAKLSKVLVLVMPLRALAIGPARRNSDFLASRGDSRDDPRTFSRSSRTVSSIPMGPRALPRGP